MLNFSTTYNDTVSFAQSVRSCEFLIHFLYDTIRIFPIFLSFLLYLFIGKIDYNGLNKRIWQQMRKEQGIGG